jgi:hypothetical protein
VSIPPLRVKVGKSRLQLKTPFIGERGMSKFFKKWIDRLRGGIMKKLMPNPPPPPIRSIPDILASLNGEQKGKWIPLDGPYVLVVPKINGKQVDFNFPTKGIVLKVFFNLNTGEIRTFILKYTDDPLRENLFE